MLDEAAEPVHVPDVEFISQPLSERCKRRLEGTANRTYASEQIAGAVEVSLINRPTASTMV
jgi:hypothetical protein